MYLPPAAAWDAGPSRWQSGLVIAAGTLGLSLCMWDVASQPLGLAFAALLILPLVCLAVAVLGLRRSPAGQLRWDGERWHWLGKAGGAQEQGVTAIDCVLDLQRVLLLRVTCEPAADQPVRWLWLESPAMTGRWLALRRAVVAADQSLRLHQDHFLPG